METISSACSPKAASPSIRMLGNLARAVARSVRFVRNFQAIAWGIVTVESESGPAS